jgi:hypothetical protein
MFIRATIGKFPTKLKCDIYLAYIRTEILPKLEKNSKIISLRTLIIGEGKTLGIATYDDEKDFIETNKWLAPLLKEASVELDGQFESMPGDVVLSFDKPVVT